MAFAPITVSGRTCNAAPLRYRIRIEHGKPRLHVAVATSLLSQVKGEPLWWRLDIDLKAKRGRLTGLVQNDGSQATRKLRPNGKVAAAFTWGLDSSGVALFPDEDKVTALHKVEVTSLGVEFDLP